jgi:hypothetical protein
MKPLKWKKYLKLVEYDLASLTELERDIHRYPLHDFAQIETDLCAALLLDAAEGQHNLYVVKLVPLAQQGQLPNLRISDHNDLSQLHLFVENYDLSRYVEIWFCRTSIDRASLNVAGRLSFYMRNQPHSQILEQVWWCSPRLIETYNQYFEYPYVRASRSSWGWRYRIEEAHIPDNSELTRHRQELEFSQSTLLLERCRCRLECFEEFIHSKRERDFSIEYKIAGSNLSIIDWDTSDDQEVLDGN